MKQSNVFRSLAGAGAAVVLLAGMTACGGDSPDDASKDDFCDAMEKVINEADDFDKTKDAVADLADVGTPDDMDDDARDGFELLVDAYDDADDEDELEKAEDDLDSDEEDQSDAFGKYYLDKCGSQMPSGLPSDMSTDMPTDIPTGLPSDLPSDIPTTLPSDLPTEIPSDLLSDLPSELLTMLPSDMPSN